MRRLITLSAAIAAALALTGSATAGGWDTTTPRITMARASAFVPAPGLYTTFNVRVRVCDNSWKLRIRVTEMITNFDTLFSTARKTVYGSGCHEVYLGKRSRSPFLTGDRYVLSVLVTDAAGNWNTRDVRIRFYSD
jgi:hypothetical protein